MAMIPTLRRVALLVVLTLLWYTPYVLPFAEGPGAESRNTAGWFAAFVLSSTFTALLVWSLVDDIPRMEQRWPRAWQLVLIAGGSILAAGLARWADGDAATTLHGAVVVKCGGALALPAAFVLTSRALKRPVSIESVLLHRWVAGVALVLFWSPPYVPSVTAGLTALFSLACWIMWLRELPVWEDRAGARKWPMRLIAVAVALAPRIVIGQLLDRYISFKGLVVFASLILLTPLVQACEGLTLTVLFMSAADMAAWLMRRSRSVRTRMLVLGLASAGLALALTRVRGRSIGADTSGNVIEDRPLAGALHIGSLIVSVTAFSITLSRGLSRSLEQSVRAISEIRRGNLNVALDDSGRDEMAEVARSFNKMVAMLREAEFLREDQRRSPLALDAAYPYARGTASRTSRSRSLRAHGLSRHARERHRPRAQQPHQLHRGQHGSASPLWRVSHARSDDAL